MKKLIKKLLREMLDEGYGQVEQLNIIGEKLLEKFINSNVETIYNILLNKFLGTDLDIMFKNHFLISDIIKDSSVYENLLPNNLSINFTTNIKINGFYVSQEKVITINLSRGFKNFNDLVKAELKKEDIEEITFNDIREIMNKCFIVLITTINHELRHAYEDFISNGKYKTDKKSIAYYAEKEASDNFKDKSPEEKERYDKIYLQMPHEYWARFTSTAKEIDEMGIIDFEAYREAFENKFYGWEVLSPTAQRRVTKALYKYFDMRNDEKNNLNESENKNLPKELLGRRFIGRIGGRDREYTTGTVYLEDLKVLDNGIETAKNTYATDKTFKPSKKPIIVGVDIETGIKQLLDGYHRYIARRGFGEMKVYFIPMKDGDIRDFSTLP